MDEALSKIVESGILGALVVVLMIAVYFLYKEVARVRKEKDDQIAFRIADLKEFENVGFTLITEVKNSLKLFTDLIQATASKKQ